MKVEVAPMLLEWACRRGGLDEQTLLSAFPKLPEWKAGKTQPTLKQLEKFAKKNHVPLGMLFLPSPPEEQLPIPDFRTIQTSAMTTPSRELLETIYLCQQRQDWYSQYLRDSGFENNKFIGSVNINDDNVGEVAHNIREAVGFSLEDRQNINTWGETLRFFIEKVGQLQILVMVSGIVGNNTNRSLDPNEFRGFALVDPIIPLIFINGKDTKAAQIFTLAHELAHIWLGEQGISNIQAIDINNQQQIEFWCNKVAAELLVPLANLKRQYNSQENLPEELQRLAKLYKVSTLVILRRLYDIGAYSYQDLRQFYQNELRNLEQIMKNKQGSGGNFYRTLEARVNQYFLQAVVVSSLEGKTLFRDAFKLLSIRNAETFFKLANRLEDK